MRKLTIAAFAVLLLTGCASTKMTEEMNALKSRVAQLESSAGNASAAQSAAAEAKREAASAAAMAERALSAAQGANEKIDRMANTCCSRK